MASKAVAKQETDPEAMIVAEAAQIEDPQEVARAIMQRILQAETAEAVLQQAGTTSARDILEVPLVLQDARFMRSAFEEGPGAFAVLDCVNTETGEAIPVTCGGRNVLAQVFQLKRLGALPRQVRFREAGQTAQGYKPLWLVEA